MNSTRLLLEVCENGLWRIQRRCRLQEAEAIARELKALLKAENLDEVSLTAEIFTARGAMRRERIYQGPTKAAQARALTSTTEPKPMGLLARLLGHQNHGDVAA